MLTPDALANGQRTIKDDVNGTEQTSKVEKATTENAFSFPDAVNYLEGFWLDNQARISGEGTKWPPLSENARTQHWSTNSPLARVHIRRRRESLKTIPTIKVRACVPDAAYLQSRNLATDNEKLNEKRALRAALPRSRWRSEEQLSPITRTLVQRCLVGENGSTNNYSTAHRALSERGLPCLHCRDSTAHTFAMRELKRQQQMRKKNRSVSSLNPAKDSPPTFRFECNGWTNLPDAKKMVAHVVRSDDIIWSNRSRGSCINNNNFNNNNNNNNCNRDRVAFLRANSTALSSASAGDPARPDGTPQQQDAQAPWQPLSNKAFVPILLQDIEDFDALSDMESRLSESSLSLANEKQAGFCCALTLRCCRCCYDQVDYCIGLCLNCPSFWSILFLLIDIPCALCFCKT